MLLKFFQKAMAHKILSGFVVILVALGAYWGYKFFKGDAVETRYVLAAVEKGTLIASVSGSGQVSASDQIDLTAKASGEITYLNVKKGSEVKSGALLAQLDSSDAQKSVRDAESNLASAKLSLEKLKQPTDELTILQAENSLLAAKESKKNTEEDLVKAYDDGFNSIANGFLDLPTVMSGLQDLLYANSYNQNQSNVEYYTNVAKYYDEKVFQYKNDAETAYRAARVAYDKNFSDYKAASRFSEILVIENLISETYDTTKTIAEAVKSANNLIQFYQDKLTERNLDPQSLADTHLASLNVYTGKTNTHLSSLFSIQSTIKNSKESIISSDRTIIEKTASLAELRAGPDALDIRAQELSIKQKENALSDAKEKFADYFVKAPFDGVVAETNVKKGDTVSSGVTIATLITKQKIAEISLNEVDAAKVKVGQKTTLTFDAVEELSLTGEVIEVDTLGTVSQGVVTYTVKINFDTQDERVKSGMSVSANIITDMKQDVLMAPNSAIKFLGETSYVEMPNETVGTSLVGTNSGIVLTASPRQQTITTGLANDSYTEVVSGLSDGDQIITRTVSASTANSTSNSSSNRSSSGNIFNMGGGPAAGSVMIRQ